jgi:hypothetical protein
MQVGRGCRYTMAGMEACQGSGSVGRVRDREVWGRGRDREVRGSGYEMLETRRRPSSGSMLHKTLDAQETFPFSCSIAQSARCKRHPQVQALGLRACHVQLEGRWTVNSRTCAALRLCAAAIAFTSGMSNTGGADVLVPCPRGEYLCAHP